MNDTKMHPAMPNAETVLQELAKAKSAEDFFGKDGIFAKLFAKTLEQMLEAEVTEHLGYDKYSKNGYNTGNSRNGKYRRKLRSSQGETEIEVPRDRRSEFEPKILHKYQTSTSELEDKIVSMYAKGMTTRDITDTLYETYGMEVSASLISRITEKVMPLVEEWQARPLEDIYPIIFLDCIHVKLRRDGRIQNTAVYIALAVNTDGKKEVLGHWVGDGGEGSNFWLSVITDLQNRGVKDVLIACVDGLKGFKEAINSVFPDAIVQKCIIHQIRNSLKYVSWKDKKEFVTDLKRVYQASTKEEAETGLLQLDEKWSAKYKIAVKSWQDNWEDLSQYFQFTYGIRRLIYTTNILEGYNRMIRKVTKTRSNFPTEESILKIMYLATRDIERKWTMSLQNWTLILSQLAIRFEGRLNLS